MGLRSRHQVGTTDGPRGETPVIRWPGRYFECNVVSAITNRGHLAFQVLEGTFNAAVFQSFLERLLREDPGKIYLVLDNLRVHRAKVLQPWLAEQAVRLMLFFLPSYSPELNPDEPLNGDLKSHTGGKKRARSLDELKKNTTEHLEARRTQPEVVASFFKEKHMAYAA
jgi:transposase